MTLAAWTCSFCRLRQLATENNTERHTEFISVGNTDKGSLALRYNARRCLNETCNKLSLSVSIHERKSGGSSPSYGPALQGWNLLPASSAKPMPEYVPEPIRQDYYEACLIRDKSPKAAATLARRCLQGMLHDFCGIALRTLDLEIKELRKRLNDNNAPHGVSVESINAIDHVRTIGNIGAHMEADINYIIEIDPGEAQILIELIESLIEEWYTARQERSDRFAKLGAMAAEKKAAVDAGKAIQKLSPGPSPTP